VLTPVLLALVALFLLLFVVRVGGAQRRLIFARWPAILFAGAALVAIARGAIWPALALGSMAGLIWLLWPGLSAPRTAQAPAGAPPDSADDAQARAILGVGAAATESDIRAAYRAKMRRAHPDQGGAHHEAARLTAARDRLLKKLGGR
jgi:hypothetical protein